ncbi:hypothetical protein [Hymenobacter profundi]|uniref:Curlin n=1 Tax=Hymenobacter profundi TaxID=1982110 RepID=A0ABS6WYU4_9BACT|nr:hypothetical protein [Hymenobacter profundi]MBW3128767.1 hypothetical protein [Hymenobacter profundi]
MKKIQLLLAGAVLLAGAAHAQTGTRAEFRNVNDCIGCETISLNARPVNQSNPNPNYSAPSLASIDNCSVVIQGQASGAPAKDRGDNNVAVVDQSGTKNNAQLYQREGNRNYGLQVQTGTSNQAQTIVWGSQNTTIQLQNGSRNKAGINVDQVDGSYTPGGTENGNNNWAQQRQQGTGTGVGNDNIANLNQYGNNNLSSQDQQGNSNSGDVFQHTNYSTAVQQQTGDLNTAVTLQGKTLASGVIMSGDQYQRSSIQQGGNSNAAIVSQDRR